MEAENEDDVPDLSSPSDSQIMYFFQTQKSVVKTQLLWVLCTVNGAMIQARIMAIGGVCGPD